MKKRFLLLLMFVFLNCLSQENRQWGSYFSYYQIIGMAQSDNVVYAASESAIFSQNTLTGELKTITSVDGLKAETITAIYHSNDYNRTLVGNSNGLVLVINRDGSIVSKIDIVEETTVPSYRKKINTISEYNGLAYIACDFGISVLNLATLEFVDTYYIGSGGAEVPIKQVAVYNGYIYAVTDGYGIRKATLDNPNLNDFSQWQEILGGGWTGITTFGTELYAIATTGNWYHLSGDNPFPFAFVPEVSTDIRDSNGYLVGTYPSKVLVYNQDLNLALQINTIPGNNSAVFTYASVVNGTLYIGTRDDGVYSVSLTNLSLFTNITPSGPLRNKVFSLKKTPNSLWAVFGSYNFNFTADYSRYGISKLTDEGWVNIPYQDLVAPIDKPVESIISIAVNPNNENEVYFNSWHSGLLKVVDDIAVILYDDANSPLRSQQSVPNFRAIRVNSTFDTGGKLWVINSGTDNPLKVKNNENWTSYSFQDQTDSPHEDDYGKLVIDKNGTKWIPSELNGIIAFNEGLNNKLLLINEENDNLPSVNTRCVAIDNNNRLWIGTTNGLRVLSNIEQFLTEDELSVNSIIIEEDGLAQELMYEQVITDIVVDGSNNKWIATGGAGAFLVSPDGQKTLFHFTKQNSPLPSNVINDIEINQVNGEVFFATDKGLISYKGTSTAPEGDLQNVYVYPNPVRPGFEGEVKISGLMDDVNVKITDIEGNLVFETTSEGGTVLWDTRAFGKYKVASGVYMIFISSDDGLETKVKKVMIVR
ncbi:type IX secretion system anionic LPS delivery protein PorZ [Flavobacterium rhizosphaerae]|uniref:T9SS type A sorting domain-containing protein n=1 Tax=Flavobacterium rhizosphaerae TaxID=3163298 RepID=A0ABW8YYR0_9FLAO